jgi:hypothetical protein
LHPFDIDVVLIEPGAILTDWNSIARDSLIKYSGQGSYGDAARAHVNMMALADRGFVAVTTTRRREDYLRAVQASKPRTRYAVGGGAKMLLFLRSLLSDRAFDAMMRMFERQTIKSAAQAD